MFKSFSAGLLFAVSFVGLAQACPITDDVGQPRSNDHNSLVMVCHTGYESGYSPATKTPRWVAEKLEAANMRGNVERGEWFAPDPTIPLAISARLSDYKGAKLEVLVDGRPVVSKLARGHMAPAANFQYSEQVMRQSFYFTNMVPQVQKCNNSGIWSKLEDMERDWTVHYGNISVVSGPIYTGERPYTIGDGVAVPELLYKVLYNPALHETLAFVVPNLEVCGSKPRDFLTTQAEVERLSGIRFFPNVTGALQASKIWQ